MDKINTDKQCEIRDCCVHTDITSRLYTDQLRLFAAAHIHADTDSNFALQLSIILLLLSK